MRLFSESGQGGWKTQGGGKHAVNSAKNRSFCPPPPSAAAQFLTPQQVIFGVKKVTFGVKKSLLGSLSGHLEGGPESHFCRGRKKPININNFTGLSRKWVGVKLFICVSPFPGEKGKHINKIPRKSQEKAGRVPGQSRDNPGTIP